jgi:hypothetical protein
MNYGKKLLFLESLGFGQVTGFILQNFPIHRIQKN